MSAKRSGDKCGDKLEHGKSNSDTIQIQDIQNEINSVITLELLATPEAFVPITFCDIPLLIDEVWQYMRLINTADFQTLDTKENYEVFLKCVLVLCQAKLMYAHKRVTVFKSSLHKLMDKKNTQSAIAQMAATLPVPIAILLDSIGITKFCRRMLCQLLQR
jgi:hypothetical protein